MSSSLPIVGCGVKVCLLAAPWVHLFAHARQDLRCWANQAIARQVRVGNRRTNLA